MKTNLKKMFAVTIALSVLSFGFTARSVDSTDIQSKEFNNKTKEVSCTDQNAFYGINKLKEYKRREEIAKSELKNSGLLKKGRKHGYNY